MRPRLMIDGQPVVRFHNTTVKAEDVHEGDFLFDLPVKVVDPHDSSQHIVVLKGFDGDEGFRLEISKSVLVPVTWKIPVMKGECKVCGTDAKYRDLCAAHYQAQRRAARSVPGAGQDSREVELPFG